MTDSTLAELARAAEADPSDAAALHALADRLVEASGEDRMELLHTWAAGAKMRTFIGAALALPGELGRYAKSGMDRIVAASEGYTHPPVMESQAYYTISGIGQHATRFAAERLLHPDGGSSEAEHYRQAMLRQCGQQIMAAIEPDHWYAVRFELGQERHQRYGVHPWMQGDRLRLELLVSPLDGGEVIRLDPPAS